MLNNFSFENRSFYETVWQPAVEPERPQMTMSFGAYAFIAGLLRQEYKHIHTHNKR
jgi:hypothetical protein